MVLHCLQSRYNKYCPNFPKLLLTDCPTNHVVVNPKDSNTAEDILIDDCSEKNVWQSAADSEIIINMGCNKRLKGLQIKNIRKSLGGTKSFSIYLSESQNGGWHLVLTDELAEEEEDSECGTMQYFDLK